MIILKSFTFLLFSCVIYFILSVGERIASHENCLFLSVMLHLTFNLLSLFKGRTLSCRYLTSTGLYIGTSSIIQTKKALSKSVDYIIVSKVCASRTKDLCYKLEGAAGSMDEVVRTEGCEDIH